MADRHFTFHGPDTLLLLCHGIASVPQTKKTFFKTRRRNITMFSVITLFNHPQSNKNVYVIIFYSWLKNTCNEVVLRNLTKWLAAGRWAPGSERSGIVWTAVAASGQPIPTKHSLASAINVLTRLSLHSLPKCQMGSTSHEWEEALILTDHYNENKMSFFTFRFLFYLLLQLNIYILDLVLVSNSRIIQLQYK